MDCEYPCWAPGLSGINIHLIYIQKPPVLTGARYVKKNQKSPNNRFIVYHLKANLMLIIFPLVPWSENEYFGF